LLVGRCGTFGLLVERHQRQILAYIKFATDLGESRYRSSTARRLANPTHGYRLAELGQRSLDAAWTADFPPKGRFTPASIKERKY
jgi:hypothetical protein